MPYKSKAQRRWAHTPSGKAALGGRGVDEWDSATDGKDVPERAGRARHDKGPGHRFRSAGGKRGVR